jgi:hypothetical protein
MKNLTSRSEPKKDDEEGSNRSGLSPDVLNTIRFFIAFMVLGAIGIVWHCGFRRETAATSLLWALACLSAGAAIGFLFGIPKILQSDKLPAPASDNKPAGSPPESKPSESSILYRQQVNTNLTEISDWLTKIIVGVSLINLKEFPPHLSRLADILAVSLDTENPAKEKAFALAIVICFSVIGFLFGYLSTRLFLAGAFSRADQGATAGVQAQNSTQIASLEANLNLLKQALYPERQPEAAQPAASAQGAPEEANQNEMDWVSLMDMANNYLRINVADWSERVRLKDEAANRMADYILKKNIPKDLLAAQAEKLSHEGLIIALASVINAFPEKGDLERLLRVAPKASRLHVRYRVVLALGKLFRERVAGAADVEPVERVLSLYSQGADDSLRRLIENTRSAIRQLVQNKA